MENLQQAKKEELGKTYTVMEKEFWLNENDIRTDIKFFMSENYLASISDLKNAVKITFINGQAFLINVLDIS